MKFNTLIFLFLLFPGLILNCPAQISPGPLSSFHTQLEGLSNCTNCHDIGNKVSNGKCLACHSELKARTDVQKGYHASSAIRGKECITCHNEHHGVNFKLVKFDQTNFDHNLTGFILTGMHAQNQCKDCHKAEFIGKQEIKKKKFTFLGLNTTCLTCHADYHLKTLPANCSDCHGNESFKPATGFNHDKARFQLKGQHQKVECVKCHKAETTGEKKIRTFTGIPFNSCSNCHKDVHQNRFGQNCSDCHTEVSFHSLKQSNNFDHNKTSFALQGKHQSVKCTACHKTAYTNPLKHVRCDNCHKDYHNAQFTREGVVTDCSNCHNNNGFQGSSYTIEEHNRSKFPLNGSHLATPCTACHKKQEKWSFRQIGTVCSDCHINIHENHINKKYFPENTCDACHNSERWNKVKFDHSSTGFNLSGVHSRQSCRSCHFPKDNNGIVTQRFSEISPNCTGCHTDIHYKQFEINGQTSCERCHVYESWKISIFDHNKTSFKLDGKHAGVTCEKCHKKVENQQNTYVLYKIKNTRCENCHS
ncbi:MAG: cytochrome C [Bacteroidetes bacterium]|nr:cytochrome C [Bacteroidota bacterium]